MSCKTGPQCQRRVISDDWRDTSIRKEDLAEYIVQEDQFDVGGQVGVDSVLAQEFMMLDVIPLWHGLSSNTCPDGHERRTHLERGGVGDANGKVREHRKGFVNSGAPEREVMRDFMNGKEEVVVRRAADDIRCQDEERGEWAGITEKDRYSKLQRHNAENDPFCDGLVSHEFRHLGAP